MAKKPAKKLAADPLVWLKKKLGKAAFADVEAGMKKAAQAQSKGKGKEAEVAGQGTCYADCNAYCWSQAASFGSWSRWFRIN